MYNALSNAITYQEYTLPEITKRINTMYCLGHITDEQRSELQQLAVEQLTPQQPADMLAVIKGVADRVTELETWRASMESGGEETDYPDWEPWDYISDQYQYGDIVRYKDGNLYRSICKTKNTWEPVVDDPNGQLWELYTPEEA